MNFLTFTSPLKRFYKFLLKRVLGSFLQYELDLNQLDVQLAKGEVILRDLELNVQVREKKRIETRRRRGKGEIRAMQQHYNVFSPPSLLSFCSDAERSVC